MYFFSELRSYFDILSYSIELLIVYQELKQNNISFFKLLKRPYQ